MSASRRFTSFSLCIGMLLGGSLSAASAATVGDALVKSGAIDIKSNTIADMAESAAPAVVNLEVSRPRSQNQLTSADGMPEELFELFRGMRMIPIEPNSGPGANPNNKRLPGVVPRTPDAAPRRLPEAHGIGSGFIVRPDGYIVTNLHVVRNASKIKVTLNDKRVFDGTVVGTDGFSDLAVVKINATNLPCLTIGQSSNLRPGEFCIAVGSPGGLDHTVSLGIISAKERNVADINGNINFIQTDAAINPGNSGGPLLNLAGEVIGVNTAINAGLQNVGFSIPADVAKNVVNDLIEKKRIDRPWLGIAMSELDEPMVKGLGLSPGTRGVVVGQVLPQSPAMAGGLESHDIIQKIDGKPVTTPKEVQEYVRAHKVQDTLNIVVLRDAAVKAIPIVIGQYPDRPVGSRAYAREE